MKVGGVGERVTKKKNIVAGPGMCLGETEPSLLSHPQLCRPGWGAGHRQGRVTLRTGQQLPTCSWQAGRLPAPSPVGEELGSTWAGSGGSGLSHPSPFISLSLGFPHDAMTRCGEMLKQGDFSVRDWLNKRRDSHTF